MATLEDLVVRVSADTDEAKSGMDKLSTSMDKNFGKITAAGAVAGAGLEAFARKMAPLNEQNSQLAAMTGMSEDAMRELAIETANVTFPLEDVQDLMRTAAERGLEGADALQEYATFWDMVGDATGEAGPALGEAGVALNAVGIAAGEEEKALGALGFITDHTTGSVGEFLEFLERTGPELGEMGADVDDAAAILGVMESELGLTGRTARTEFREAVGEADGDMQKLLDTLGISEDQFAAYRSEVDDASGVIERNADIHADSFTPMQKLQHKAEELMFQYGGLADAAGMLAIPMLALGPASKAASLGIRGVGKAGKKMRLGAAVKSLGAMGMAALRAGGRLLVAAGMVIVSAARMVASMVATAVRVVAGWVLMAVQSLLNAARMALAWLIAMGPIGIIIAVVIALVALIIANWDKIWAFTKMIFSKVWSFLKGLWEKIAAFVGTAIGFIKDIFFKFNPVGIIIKNWDPIWTFIKNLWDKALGFLKKIPGKIKGFFKGMWDPVKSGARAAINGAIGLVNGAIGGINMMIRGANKLPGVNIPQVGMIPRLAKGGIVTGPTLALLGEGGQDEAVIPLPPGMRRGGDGASAGVLRLDVTGADEDMRRVIRKWIREDDLVEGAAP